MQPSLRVEKQKPGEQAAEQLAGLVGGPGAAGKIRQDYVAIIERGAEVDRAPGRGLLSDHRAHCFDAGEFGEPVTRAEYLLAKLLTTARFVGDVVQVLQLFP